MKNFVDPSKRLSTFLHENYGEMDCMVGIGEDTLLVYVKRGKKHMKEIPREWEGVTVKKKWVGRVYPL